MMNVVASHPQNLQLPLQDASLSLSLRGRLFINSKGSNKVQCLPASSPCSSSGGRCSSSIHHPHTRRFAVIRAAGDGRGGESSSGGQDDDDEEGGGDNEVPQSSSSSSSSREDLERLVGPDEDDKFNGLDLANLIRKKYGRSYDVTLIKKEFMGRNLLAMNVMWKYREQRSFPLSEEEYLLRLDEVANTLRCWGAVAHVRNTLEKLKERPRIGKAVSIFIDMDQTGGRANEWIYK
ncbi:uncharacterized protein LOC101753565 [Setaria italica]|uniref:uncharacterized protein LOC101753565 n=1 Tax=Setaria italica TaxID=4555 RepID=UPI000351250A|nr:uncharacterized protein LOC101753565 [Setaria italica]XP_004954505.1 uncharacterized protein LOC101753565 [Setaria italica]